MQRRTLMGRGLEVGRVDAGISDDYDRDLPERVVVTNNQRMLNRKCGRPGLAIRLRDATFSLVNGENDSLDKIGLFGGSFNPIHHGHLIMARALAERAGLSNVIFLPCGAPPHKNATELISGVHRGEMVRLAINGEAHFAFSDFDLARPGPAYTIDTVRHFRSELGSDVSLYWIIGADTLSELPTWHLTTELVEECTILTAARPGWASDAWEALSHTFRDDQIIRLRDGVLETPPIDISATDIRHRIAAGLSVSYLLPLPVIAFIRANGLYLA